MILNLDGMLCNTSWCPVGLIINHHHSHVMTTYARRLFFFSFFFWLKVEREILFILRWVSGWSLYTPSVFERNLKAHFSWEKLCSFSQRHPYACETPILKQLNIEAFNSPPSASWIPSLSSDPSMTMSDVYSSAFSMMEKTHMLRRRSLHFGYGWRPSAIATF